MTHRRRLGKNKAWEELKEALDSLTEQEREQLKCVLNPDKYQNLPDHVQYTKSELQKMCGGCPVEESCRRYGDSDRNAEDVWGGKQQPKERIGSLSDKR